MIHVGVTRSPTDAWTAQQLREATDYGVGPKYLIRDNDDKFGVGFARAKHTSRIEILKTPYFAPRANAICERFLDSVAALMRSTSHAMAIIGAACKRAGAASRGCECRCWNVSNVVMM